MAKKKHIYCRCGSECSWYKKGKNHRVLVCNRCGVIANNPAPLALAASALAPTLIEKGVEMFSKKKSTSADAANTQHIITDSKDKPNYSERVINQVMRSEGL